MNDRLELCKALQAGITEVDMEDEVENDGAQLDPESLAAANAKGRWVMLHHLLMQAAGTYLVLSSHAQSYCDRNNPPMMPCVFLVSRENLLVS